MTENQEIQRLRADIEALKTAKARLIKLRGKLQTVNEYRRNKKRDLRRNLETGDGGVKSYATWTKEQFGEGPEHKIVQGTTGRKPIRG